MESRQSEKRFALLIDADNVSAKYLKPIMDELSKYGTVTYKRIYGDWTLAMHSKWKNALLENSITPIQQFGYTQGKNATDSAMIIDAMDILYTNSVEGFCIVSSDSDFTRLAARIRESGLTVIGMGEQKTPTPFRRACDIFTTLELLAGEKSSKRKGGGMPTDSVASDGDHADAVTIASKNEIERAVVDIITDNQNNGKATGLGEVGSRLLKRYPDFDVRSYGTNLLSKLLDEFESVKITKDGSNVAVELADMPLPADAAADEPSNDERSSEEAAADEPKARKTRRRRRKIKLMEAKGGVEAGEADGSGEVGDSGEAPLAVSVLEASEEPAFSESTVIAASDEQVVAPVAKPKKKPRPRRKKGVKVVEESVSSVPLTVEGFIRGELAAAGAEGVELADLGKRVRARFRDFRVRELGYRHLRAYVIDIEGLGVEKREEGFFAIALS